MRQTQTTDLYRAVLTKLHWKMPWIWSVLRELVGVMRNLGPPANHPKCAEIIVQNIRIFTPLFPQIAIAIGVPRAGLASRGIAGSDVVQEPRKVNKQDENLANCPGNFETIGFMRGDRSSRRFFMTCANLTPKRPSRWCQSHSTPFRVLRGHRNHGASGRIRSGDLGSLVDPGTGAAGGFGHCGGDDCSYSFERQSFIFRGQCQQHQKHPFWSKGCPKGLGSLAVAKCRDAWLWWHSAGDVAAICHRRRARWSSRCWCYCWLLWCRLAHGQSSRLQDLSDVLPSFHVLHCEHRWTSWRGARGLASHVHGGAGLWIGWDRMPGGLCSILACGGQDRVPSRGSEDRPSICFRMGQCLQRCGCWNRRPHQQLCQCNKVHHPSGALWFGFVALLLLGLDANGKCWQDHGEGECWESITRNNLVFRTILQGLLPDFCHGFGARSAKVLDSFGCCRTGNQCHDCGTSRLCLPDGEYGGSASGRLLDGSLRCCPGGIRLFAVVGHGHTVPVRQRSGVLCAWCQSAGLGLWPQRRLSHCVVHPPCSRRSWRPTSSLYEWMSLLQLPGRLAVARGFWQSFQRLQCVGGWQQSDCFNAGCRVHWFVPISLEADVRRLCLHEGAFDGFCGSVEGGRCLHTDRAGGHQSALRTKEDSHYLHGGHTRDHETGHGWLELTEWEDQFRGRRKLFPNDGFHSRGVEDDLEQHWTQGFRMVVAAVAEVGRPWMHWRHFGELLRLGCRSGRAGALALAEERLAWSSRLRGPTAGGDTHQKK